MPPFSNGRFYRRRLTSGWLLVNMPEAPHAEMAQTPQARRRQRFRPLAAYACLGDGTRLLPRVTHSRYAGRTRARFQPYGALLRAAHLAPSARLGGRMIVRFIAMFELLTSCHAVVTKGDNFDLHLRQLMSRCHYMMRTN